MQSGLLKFRRLYKRLVVTIMLSLRSFKIQFCLYRLFISFKNGLHTHFCQFLTWSSSAECPFVVRCFASHLGTPSGWHAGIVNSASPFLYLQRLCEIYVYTLLTSFVNALFTTQGASTLTVQVILCT